MTAVVLAVSAVLAAVAAAGVLAPFLSGRTARPEPADDPREEERDELLQALRDLEEDREAGRVDEPAYRSLRAETAARAVAVIRTLEGDGDPGAGLRELRRRPEPPPASGWRRTVPAAVAAAVLVAIIVPALASTLATRVPGETVTGGGPGGSPLAALEQRVREHPADPAARLDLAEAYLARGEPDRAIEQYVAVLEADPQNPEARTRLAAVLFGAGRPREALEEVDRALEADPSYPLALYYRGVILLEGLGRRTAAEEAFRAYLQAAPFGAFREQAQDYLREL